jgi:hypothetical protein
MFLNILLVLVAIVVVLVIVIALRPNDFRVTRSTTIAASPAAVFPHVNDLHNWAAWSPWEKFDPNMQRTFVGAPAGVGSKYTWNGNNKIGEGSMTITDSRPNELVRILLEFVRPFKGTNNVDFTFVPQANQTVVTWDMKGKLNLVTKAFHLFVNMDKMIGGQFEEGLANLKRVSEKG